MKLLVGDGYNSDKQEKYGGCGLMLAIRHQQSELSNLLLSNRADLNFGTF